jgi:dienelactone hydrolase
MTRTLPLLALCCVLQAATAPAAPRAATAAPRIEVVPWRADLVPAFLAGSPPDQALRAFPPDTLAPASRPTLQATFAAQLPRLDGAFDDWPDVRWRDLRGGGGVVRGKWTGPEDAVLRFALLWTEKGLVLGARLQDDVLDAGRAPDARSPAAAPRQVESVLLYVGSDSPVVQRYWRGAEQAVRLFADGRIEAWTRLRNDRPVLFDPRFLGAGGRAVLGARQGQAGSADFELFVPWDLLFPALPHEQAALLVDVLLEDFDAGANKLFSWATRPDSTGLHQAWARLVCAGGPPAGTWMTSLASPHVEAGQPVEWSLLRWNSSPEARSAAVEVRAAGPNGWKPLRSALPAGPCLVRVNGVPAPSLPWPPQRRIEVDVGLAGATPWRHDALTLAPTQACLDAGAAEIVARAKSAPAPATSPAPGAPATKPPANTTPGTSPSTTGPSTPGAGVFPLAEDVLVLLAQVAGGIRQVGDWHESRLTHRAIGVWRAAGWAALEDELDAAELRRDVLFAGGVAQETRQRAAAAWPERRPGGLPVAQPILRGYRSVLDGSVQPYVVYVSRAAAAGSAAPLLVVLHGLSEDAMAPFASTTLASEVESRGWIALCPYGRGNTGFEMAGERDVIDVIGRVQADLPVDASRMYVAGYSIGGTGAWLLSLRHADLFAAAAVVSAYGDLDQPGIYESLAYHPAELFFYETMNPARLVRPNLRVAYRIVHGEQDPIVSVVHARVMDDKLSEYKIPHELRLLATPDHGVVLFERELHANLDYLAAHHRNAPGAPEPAWFGGNGGPVGTVFARGPFAVVYGTHPLPRGAPAVGAKARSGLSVTGPAADKRTAEQFVQEWEAIFAGRPQILPDTAVTPQLQKSTNLVVVGDPRTNRVLAAAAAQLPVHYKDDSFEVEGTTRQFEAAGILFAVANPAAPERTLVVLSGMGERQGGPGKSLVKLGADYVVTDDRRGILAIGDFRGFGNVRAQPGDAAPR